MAATLGRFNGLRLLKSTPALNLQQVKNIDDLDVTSKAENFQRPHKHRTQSVYKSFCTIILHKIYVF